MSTLDDKPPVPHTIKEIIRNFTPTWFAVTMGTGAISILFSSFPYGHDTELMKILCLAFFFLNLFLFIFFTAITIARYWFYPHIWGLMIRHPVSSLYTGCFPMGATTLINVAVDVINERRHFGGKGFLYFIWAIWWLDVFISILCCWVLVHFMKTSQKHSLQAMTSVWLLPVVTLTVAASSGGILARALQKYSPLHALVSATVAVFLVITGLTLALMILTIYLLRLIVYGLPPGATVLSVFLPLGPTGQSGFAVLLIGQNFKSLLPLDHGTSDILRSSSIGDTINVISICTAFLLWSLASMWIIYALLAVHEVTRQTRFPFKLPFWGLVFPNGVYANLTINLSITFDSAFFRVFGAIYAIATMFLWLFVTIRTLRMVFDRTIFELEDIDIAQFDRRAEQQRYPLSTTPTLEAEGPSNQQSKDDKHRIA